MNWSLKKLGPGLLFAGAAIGVSHLVQSTQAGANYGLGLIWALVLVNIFKYPFFQYGPRYAAATGESLLEGYKKLGKWVLILYFIITFATMFTIQTAVTMVTAGLAKTLFHSSLSLETWCLILLLICIVILVLGRFKILDKLMKVIIITLTISSIIAVIFAFGNPQSTLSFSQVLPVEAAGITFLIAFMGWMPAPLDIAVWHSLWALEKKKGNTDFTPKSMLFDFNVGYVSTLFLGLIFVLLGALVMYNTGAEFSGKAGKFANQLIEMYTKNLGGWSYIIIGIAAFTTMFSTTLTTLDASPRSMQKTTELLMDKTKAKTKYLHWIFILTIGTLFIFMYFKSEMVVLIKVATILSFLTAPFYAIINFKLITSKHTPKKWHPSKPMQWLSIAGIVFLIGFSIWYISLS